MKKISIIMLAFILSFSPINVNATEVLTEGQKNATEEYDTIEEENTIVPVVDIEIGNHETELLVGNTVNISATVVPSEATNSMITYKSSDASIATVSSTGEVRGVGAGVVTITLTAGDVSKDIVITVKVATTEIQINSDYLVLKPGDTYQIVGKVFPLEASQSMSYKSLDTKIATVSSSGYVTAKKSGSTTIVVSNGDLTVAVSVIVNQPVSYNQQDEQEEQDMEEEKVYADIVKASEHSIIDSEMLKYLYENKLILKIVGNGYTVEIDGNEIVNYNNEFYTDVSVKEENGATSFCLNQGNDLCGAIKLTFDEPKGKYLYLYNEAKGKYEAISVEQIDELTLTTAGEYQIRNEKLRTDGYIFLYIVIGGVTVSLIALGVYVVTKRKYWFW